jgi:aspartyl-tRNA(Asn)/glutamyl-tRNA(Gln) amidotransferase subunit C
MNITPDDIRKLAELSKLPLSDAEIPKLQKDIAASIAHVNKLKELNVSAIAETSQIHFQESVVRKDEPTMTFKKEDTVASFPETDEQGNLVVKAVFQDTETLTE